MKGELNEEGRGPQSDDIDFLLYIRHEGRQACINSFYIMCIS